MPVKFVSFLKSRLVFILIYCFWMLVNKLFTSQNVKVKSSTYFFHLKTKMLTDFQICISVPLNTLLANGNIVICFALFTDINFDSNCTKVWWLELICYSLDIGLHLFDNFIYLSNTAVQKCGVFCERRLYFYRKK